MNKKIIALAVLMLMSSVILGGCKSAEEEQLDHMSDMVQQVDDMYDASTKQTNKKSAKAEFLPGEIAWSLVDQYGEEIEAHVRVKDSVGEIIDRSGKSENSNYYSRNAAEKDPLSSDNTYTVFMPEVSQKCDCVPFQSYDVQPRDGYLDLGVIKIDRWARIITEGVFNEGGTELNYKYKLVESKPNDQESFNKYSKILPNKNYYMPMLPNGTYVLEIEEKRGMYHPKKINIEVKELQDVELGRIVLEKK